MKSGEKVYIWQQSDWPNWRYNLAALTPALTDVIRKQGLLLGRLADVGFELRDQSSLKTLTDEVLKTSEIEGEILNPESVRSSIARRLGVDIGALAPADRHVDGVVEMVLDATTKGTKPLTTKRLLAWHAALFPTGYSGMSKIRAGRWRNDASGAMQVVSGPIGRRKVHFEAPPAKTLPKQIKAFLDWSKTATSEPALIKAGLAHLWFVTLHPFDDGNGRIARAVGDLFLARADGDTQRFYSLSAQIQRDRKNYYDILERTQKCTLEVTPWVLWFLQTLERAIAQAHRQLDTSLTKTRLRQHLGRHVLNARQIKSIHQLIDGFEGKLTSSKWATLNKCSPDTALRDITQLLEFKLLVKTESGGRSTSYELGKV